MAIPHIAPEKTGIQRRIQRLLWSAQKRLAPGRQVTIPFDEDLQLTVFARDRLARRVRLNGYSDRDLAMLIDAYLKPGMTYFDVGAHFGQFVLMAGKRVGDRGQVHAFEPTSATFRQLENNIRLNKLGNITANHNAVYKEKTSLELHVCTPGLGEFNTLGTPARRGGEVASVEHVDAVTLDDYTSAHDIEHIDLMKIDVEGAEIHVLSGAEVLLQKPDAPALIVEFNTSNFASMGYGITDIREKLHSFGYRIYTFDTEYLALVPEAPNEEYRTMVNIVAVKDQQAFELAIGNREK